MSRQSGFVPVLVVVVVSVVVATMTLVANAQKAGPDNGVGRIG